MFTVAREGSWIALEETISLCRSLNSIGSFKYDQLSVRSKSEELPRPIVDPRFTATSQEGGDSAPAQPTKFPEYVLQIVQTYLALRAGKEVEIVLAAPFTQYREVVQQQHTQRRAGQAARQARQDADALSRPHDVLHQWLPVSRVPIHTGAQRAFGEELYVQARHNQIVLCRAAFTCPLVRSDGKV